MTVAVLSDTHGNLTAFEAVLADIDARGIDRIFHLGDVIGKGPRGTDCTNLTRQRCEKTVRGNWEAFLFDKDVVAAIWWREEVSPESQAWLTSLPFSIDLELAGTNIRLFHASSDSVFHRITRSVTDADFEMQFQNTEATGFDSPEPDIAIYGDIHFAWEKTIGKHTLINCGSVGNPLDETTASYLVLEDASGELEWELVRVPYDIEAELAIAREMKMPHYEAWECELRTGVYSR